MWTRKGQPSKELSNPVSRVRIFVEHNLEAPVPQSHDGVPQTIETRSALQRGAENGSREGFTGPSLVASPQ